MPPSEPLRVFISYARKDGATLAQRLQEDLKEQGFDAWLDTQRIDGGRVWSTEIDDAIKSCGVMIALMSPGSYASEICRSEQLLALDQSKRVIPVLAVKGADRPVYLYARQYRDFTAAANYAARLAELLGDIRGEATATLPDTYRETRVTYLTAPPRVANYLERPEALHALRDTLFAEAHRQPIALTALAGMGGIGKTVLAKALTDDEVVRRAFPDGIVWITAGKERKRDFIEEMRQVAEVLGDDTKTDKKVTDWAVEYRIRIANKAALIVVDDVWSKSDIEPLLAESPRSRFLFTTRDAAIGRFVGAHEHRADLLDVAQSRELLASWANLPVAELPAAADAVIAECRRLPLALSVVGAMLRGEDAVFWQDMLDLLRKANLSAIQEQLPEGQDSFFKAVEVSFQSLKPEMQERYKALAVLLEDMAAPLPILETLWNVDRPEARRISRNFVNRSLAQRDGADESMRLHDLQLDYVRAQYPDKTALELIHGAVRLSSNVIGEDPGQFASQLIGRLLPHRDMPAIKRFSDSVVEGTRTPWLRPLQPTLHPSGTSLIRTMEGHIEGLCRVAMSGDGRLAVSISGHPNTTVEVWEVENGHVLRTLQVHSEGVGVGSVAISGDGRLAVSTSGDKTLKVWEVESWRELRTLDGHTDEVLGVALSGDGRLAVSASADTTLKVWEVESGRELRTLKGHTDGVFGVALSGDGRLAVSASQDKTLKVWEVESGRELRTLEGHTEGVFGVALSGDGRLAVSASADTTLKVWEVESGRELRTLQGHSYFPFGVALSADGRRAVSAGGEMFYQIPELKVWEVESGRELRSLQGHSDFVSGVALSADGRRAVSASADKTLKVWDLDSWLDLPPLQGHSDWVRGVAVSRDGRVAVSASSDHTLKVWDVKRGCEVRTLQRDRTVGGVALSGDGRRAVSFSFDESLTVWDVEGGRELRTLQGHSDWVRGVAVSRDGRRAVSAASKDNTLRVWNVESGRTLRILKGHSAEVNRVALSGDGRRAVSASEDNTLRVWNVESGRTLRILKGHSAGVGGVALSEDGRRALSASQDNTLRVWDVKHGCELRTLESHSAGVKNRDPNLAGFRTNRVALSGDGRRAVAASKDRTLEVWDAETGVQIATFTADAEVLCCAFIDGHKLIAGDCLGRVHFLRLEEPKAKS